MAKSRVAAASLVPPPVSPGGASAPAVEPRLARLAWEFLRRNPAYRADYANVRSGALATLPEHWGLAAPIDPDRQEVDPLALWRTDAAGAAPRIDEPRSYSSGGRIFGRFSSSQRSAL
jgi:hypothetical protein